MPRAPDQHAPHLACRLAGTVLLAGAVLAGAAGPAFAEAPPSGRNLFLEEARRQIDRDRPEAAADELRRALDMPGLPEAQRLETLAWLGAALHLARDPVEAESVWATLFRADPDATPPADFSEEVRAAWSATRTRTVIVRHLPPPGAFAGVSLGLHADLVDRQGRTADLLAYTRRQGEAGYQVTPFARRNGGWVAEVVPPPLAGAAREYVLEYYLVAQAETGEVLHSLGDAGRPLSVITRSPPEDAVEAGRDARVDRMAPPGAVAVGETVDSTDRPGRGARWIWVAVIGAGVLAGGAAAVAASTGGDELELPVTSLGTVRYPAEGRGP